VQNLLVRGRFGPQLQLRCASALSIAVAERSAAARGSACAGAVAATSATAANALRCAVLYANRPNQILEAMTDLLVAARQPSAALDPQGGSPHLAM
jgi:hypothetical protein